MDLFAFFFFFSFLLFSSQKAMKSLPNEIVEVLEAQLRDLNS